MDYRVLALERKDIKSIGKYINQSERHFTFFKGLNMDDDRYKDLYYFSRNSKDISGLYSTKLKIDDTQFYLDESIVDGSLMLLKLFNKERIFLTFLMDEAGRPDDMIGFSFEYIRENGTGLDAS